MKQIMNEQQRLIACASSDKSRTAITSVRFEKDGYTVATDGHRLFATKHDLPSWGEHRRSGKSLLAKDLARSIVTPCDVSYPDWRAVVPRIHSMKRWATFVVPLWFRRLHEEDKADMTFAHNPSGWRLSFEQIDKEATDRFLVNPAFLAPWAGEKVLLGMSGPENPILVLPSDAKRNVATLKQETFGVVMPIRPPSSAIIQAA